MKTLEDVCLTWNEYPNYIFSPVFLGPEKSFVFKFSNCYNVDYTIVYDSRFWDIYEVKSQGLSKPAGFIFQAKGEITRATEKAISSCCKGNSYEYISSLVRKKTWSYNGIDLIRYEEAGEVITDLCTIMGVDITIE